MMLPKHFFCKCMKPWKVCVNKRNSYKLDVRDLIDTQYIEHQTKLSPLYLHYDFINKKWLQYSFKCRFLDNTHTSSKDFTPDI
jgi:hypothetical protein